MTNSIAELEDAKFILAIGTNTTESHPVIALRLKRAVRKGAKLVVADPRRIDLVRFATRYLPIKIGSDVALLNAMAHTIVEEGLYDEQYLRDRVEGFEEYREHIKKFPPEWAEPITGIPAGIIREVAREYATAGRAAICYTLGITEHRSGVANVQCLGNLALLTGNLGVEGAGVNPFRGQNNVQGTGDVGCMPESLPGYQKVTDPEARAQVEAEWGLKISPVPGLKKPEVIEAVHAGRIRGMLVWGDNTVVSDTDSQRTIEALQRLDLLVVQDIFLTETARQAHVVLPAACFAEVDGVYTNTERRVHRVRKAVDPPGEARADWQIVQDLANRFGAGWSYTHPSQVFDEICRISPIWRGLSYTRIDEGGVQWPCPDPHHPGTRFLHRDRFPTASGKARLIPHDYIPPADELDDGYPLLLTTGRRLPTYHTNTMTGQAEGFDRLIAHEFLEIHPDDAAKYGIQDGSLVEVASRRGVVKVPVHLTTKCQKGVVFMSFAFFDEAPVNFIASRALDPLTLTPEFKACAVRVRPVSALRSPTAAGVR